MKRSDLTDPAELAIWDAEMEQMSGNLTAEWRAEQAVELHRAVFAEDAPREQDFSEESLRYKAHRPMPANGEQLKRACLEEAERRCIGDRVRHRHPASSERAWALLALAEAISCKHASALFGRGGHDAACARTTYPELRKDAEAFGRTLVVQWPEEASRDRRGKAA